MRPAGKSLSVACRRQPVAIFRPTNLLNRRWFQVSVIQEFCMPDVVTCCEKHLSTTQTVLPRVLIVDDDRRRSSSTAQWLCSRGWHATAVGSADEALRAFARGQIDACLLDAKLPEGGSLRVATVLRNTWPMAAIILTKSVHQNISEALLRDSHATVDLPTRDDDLETTLSRAIDSSQQASRNTGCPILGEHPSVQNILRLANQVATTPASILITGESGTGKSLLARHIHKTSCRNGNFVEVACGSLNDSLLESELFGHVAGSFTGAHTDREGKFLRAHNGTIFLDEIATASPAMQVKLLRVLQDFEFEPVGGGQTHHVDARVILATHENLEELVEDKKFRADLYWRINVVVLEMPPLRDRQDDILLLAKHFLSRSKKMVTRAIDGFSSATEELLVHHPWPGNVRELQHAVERAVLLGTSFQIEPQDLPDSFAKASTPPKTSLKQALADPERMLILQALQKNGWRRDAAAKALGINRTSLYKKAKRLGMDLASLASQYT